MLDEAGLEEDIEAMKNDKEINEQKDDGVNEKEMRRVIKRLKIKKMAGIDGILMEAWKYKEAKIKIVGDY